jgi:hypothetical protein
VVFIIEGSDASGVARSVEFLSEILEVVGADTEFRNLLDRRQEVGQRANDTQWGSIGPPNQTAGRRQD